jgi:predicted nucleotidyltransferase component of viral defense system
MIEPKDFKTLVKQAMKISNRSHMQPVIEKELLHYDILFSLDKDGLLDLLTFQGGTSLRLCYGSSRFSEDLDFTGGIDFASHKLSAMKTCIENYIGNRYQLEVTVKEPSELRKEPEYSKINVDKWQISIITSPGQRNFPKQRIKLEIANIPSYSREPQALLVNYDFLPDGYSDTLVMTETLDEIMSDKIVSLVNTDGYIRYRDIWDLRWLKQEGAKINYTWVSNKINDYKIKNYSTKLKKLLEKLPKIIHGKEFKNEISRFIPMDVQERTIKKEKSCDFLVIEISLLLKNVQKNI